MTEGWICLHRKILDWEWYSDPAAFRLFMHLLLKANHEDAEWKGKQIKRAQTLTSREHLSAQTGLTTKQIRRAEEGLTKSGSLGIQTTNKFTIYTILKYEDYQVDVNGRANKGQTKGKQEGKRGATNNNDKQYNNEVEEPPTPLPEWIEKETWDAFKEMRDKKKKPLDANAEKLALAKLENLKLKGHNPNEIIRESIINNWQGLFEPKERQLAFAGGSNRGSAGKNQQPKISAGTV